jgi:hypothetical protein
MRRGACLLNHARGEFFHLALWQAGKGKGSGVKSEEMGEGGGETSQERDWDLPDNICPIFSWQCKTLALFLL